MNFTHDEPSKNISPSRVAYDYAPNAKVFAILRNPIDRYESAYNHNVLKGRLPHVTSIDQIVSHGQMLNIGNYARTITQWQRYYPNLKILFYDDLVSNKLSFFDEIFSFLELDLYAKSCNLNIDSNITNEKYKKKLPRMQKARLTQEARNVLKNYYKDSIKKLEVISNRNLTSWLN